MNDWLISMRHPTIVFYYVLSVTVLSLSSLYRTRTAPSLKGGNNAEAAKTKGRKVPVSKPLLIMIIIIIIIIGFEDWSHWAHTRDDVPVLEWRCLHTIIVPAERTVCIYPYVSVRTVVSSTSVPTDRWPLAPPARWPGANANHPCPSALLCCCPGGW